MRFLSSQWPGDEATWNCHLLCSFAPLCQIACWITTQNLQTVAIWQCSNQVPRAGARAPPRHLCKSSLATSDRAFLGPGTSYASQVLGLLTVSVAGLLPPEGYNSQISGNLKVKGPASKLPIFLQTFKPTSPHKQSRNSQDREMPFYCLRSRRNRAASHKAGATKSKSLSLRL